MLLCITILCGINIWLTSTTGIIRLKSSYMFTSLPHQAAALSVTTLIPSDALCHFCCNHKRIQGISLLLTKLATRYQCDVVLPVNCLSCRTNE